MIKNKSQAAESGESSSKRHRSIRSFLGESFKNETGGESQPLTNLSSPAEVIFEEVDNDQKENNHDYS